MILFVQCLTHSQVDYIPTPIKRITETGIETVDGQHQEVDVIICATGMYSTLISGILL